ncbi:ArsR family transcriptional regulator [candidate division TA06 bacterium]|uniref:ArsR family transcriptional regulator n=1 Tax=candidate division TA06 bacterium TaxID=2250710 RepID=A0A523UR83_UNCT6|nr:MAG: ArsR family transcriptional regulator [candidate division TA06 bacterium]
MEDMARAFAALGNQRRFKIMVSLLGLREDTAGSIANTHRLHPTVASKHLKKLEVARLVRGERRGRCVYYSAETDSSSIAIRSILSILRRSPKRRVR